MILHATHTHLYPGHQGKISGLALIADMPAGDDCLVEFSDGTAASARIARSEKGWLLYTDAYRTAAGTDIAKKVWLVGLAKNGNHPEFRIINKVQTS